MIRKFAADKTVKTVFLQLFLLVMLVQYALACDTDTFVYEEFGQRCQKMSELIRKVQLAYKMNLPEQEHYKRILLNEWVDFFLDHGNAPPGGFTQIATSSWKSTIENAGRKLSELTYRQIDPNDADAAGIPFELLSQPVKFNAIRETIASWTKLQDEEEAETIASEGIWIGKNVAQLVRLSGLLLEPYPHEKARVKRFVKDLSENWRFVIEAEAEVAETVFIFSRKEIRKKIKRELEHWRKLSFM
ncbi:MAG: hypothetical protein Kow0029_13760 [Candidatus Rifleibacteriota bacterium]